VCVCVWQHDRCCAFELYCNIVFFYCTKYLLVITFWRIIFGLGYEIRDKLLCFQISFDLYVTWYMLLDL
jgi:hypothetical protein